MTLPANLSVGLITVTGSATDAASASTSRAGSGLRLVCHGPFSLWFGPRTVDTNVLGYRLRPGEEVDLDTADGLYLITLPNHVTYAYVAEISQ